MIGFEHVSDGLRIHGWARKKSRIKQAEWNRQLQNVSKETCLLELVEAISAMLLNNLGENNGKLNEWHHVKQNVGPAEQQHYEHKLKVPQLFIQATHVLWKMHWAIFTMGKGGLEYREPCSFSSRCGTRKTSRTENHMRFMPSSSIILCCRLQRDMALRSNCTASKIVSTCDMEACKTHTCNRRASICFSVREEFASNSTEPE